MELTPQKAKSLTVAKLREELTERGLASDGLKVRPSLMLSFERAARHHGGGALLLCMYATRENRECCSLPPSLFLPRVVLPPHWGPGRRVDTGGIGHRKYW